MGAGDAAIVGYCFGEDEGPDEEEEALDAVGGWVLAMYIYKRRWNWAMMKSQLTSTRTPSLLLRLFLSFSLYFPLSPFRLLFSRNVRIQVMYVCT